MTFFRYFPAKEEVALSDGYDPLIAALLRQAPAAWPVSRRIRAVLLQGIRHVYDTDRDTLLAQNKLIVSTPVLRERLWASQVATQEHILRALGAGEGGQRPELQARVIVAACLAAASTAILAWVEDDGATDLPALMEQAFDALEALGAVSSSPTCGPSSCRP